ncbi:MAG TPA: alcohol dehydrogenase catalytic domain-containing protein [Candidatus Dormibacteraeota bacterium]|nr:alcohol dehydrogenase catalytic domain-containing protein [Candidatus Dormibacteraeota bacterium]
MRQLVSTEDRRLEWWEVDDPRIEDSRDALVRPLAVAACDMDFRMIRGETPLPGPIALGHEVVAEVVDVGDAAAARGVAPGDVVVVPFQISCGHCARCLAGHSSMCESVPRRSMYGFGAMGGPWGGALSDLMRVPFADHMLVPLPAGVDPVAAASASDNIPDAWRCVAPFVNEGDRVLVAGGGAVSIALYAVAIAKALGAAEVAYLDDDPGRMALACELGAATVEDAPGPYEVTVDASVNPEHLATALRSTAPCGTCTSVGIYWTPATPVPLLDMYDRAVTFVTGSPHARANIPQVLDAIANETFHPEQITDAVVSFEDAADALREQHTKLVLVPGH